MIHAQIQQNLSFKTSYGKPVADVKNFIEEWLAQHPGGRIFVGTDSKVFGEKVKYSTVICLWNVGTGVWEVFRNFAVPNPEDRFTRLWNEVTISIETAEIIKDVTPNIEVHMDFNSNPKYPSFQLYDAGMGLVTSMGYQGAGKPHAWAATYGANRHCQ